MYDCTEEEESNSEGQLLMVLKDLLALEQATCSKEKQGQGLCFAGEPVKHQLLEEAESPAFRKSSIQN